MESIVKRIQGSLAAHQRHIQNLKDEGYIVIGYARKFPATNSNDDRVNILQKMCQLLKDRSSVDHVFVSICCKARDPFNEREKKDSKSLVNLNADGETQDMLNCIIGNSKVCIVPLDYAGLTTNTTDISEFLRQNQQVKKIIIDKLPRSNEVI
ncbi:uncharacterized protein B0P05DRAFT_576438 [Gilbertella persicaria]|uniref:uncharacterized protein n=1 Tax=Gilbertella persicaria TaxID=101096 RepID=UPI0022209C84|nr:uncharacterized protein B0P05DRAFT_576438 [Gilbertella persicaria]KAI8047166.1 hypothetical protein B0P05DRAFT_576438 [Gilbertella persicaria]